MILREILQLDVTTREAASTIGTIELEHTTGTAILAHRLFHRLIFTDAGLGELLPEGQDIAEFRWRSLQKLSHSLFIQTFGLQPLVGEPLLHLLHRVWIFKSGHVFHGLGQLLTRASVHFDSLMYQLHIQSDTTVVYLLVDVIFLPDRIRHRELT